MRFERLSLEQGLSQSYVNCILQDRRGFMWFGTQDGLNRYDGYGFTVFKHDALDPGSLSHNTVWALHEDRDGTLWIGTDGGGLDRWEPSTGSFQHLRHDPTDARHWSATGAGDPRDRDQPVSRNGWMGLSSWIVRNAPVSRFARTGGTPTTERRQFAPWARIGRCLDRHG